MIGHHGDSRSTSATDLDLESPERDASGKTYVEGTTPPSVAAAAHGTLKVDDVFGEIKENGPNYRDLGWLGTSVLMMKTQIGLGVLSLPNVLITLGIVPGILCLIAMAIITGWSNYVIGAFKRRHPEVYSIDDVGFLFAGRWGREAMAVIFCIFMIMVVGSGLLSISIALNAISDHGTCTAVFVVVAAIVTFMLASIRTLGQISWLGWVGLVSILAAIITLTVSVGVTNRPEAAPQTGPWDKEIIVVGNPSFLEAISAVSVLVFCYAGTPAFFGIVSEMREPKLYTRAMLLAQSVITGVLIVIGVLVYFFVGQYVSSPALGSAGPLMKKVSYGLALPGLWVTCVILSHLPAKMVFVRILRGSKHLTSNSARHWIVWLSCTFTCVALSYVVASAVPVFSGLIGLIGALFGTLLNMQLMGFMWMYDHWHLRSVDKSLKYRLLFGWNCFVIAIGTFLMVSGTYGSIVDIINAYHKNGGTTPFSCEDNSQ